MAPTAMLRTIPSSSSEIDIVHSRIWFLLTHTHTHKNHHLHSIPCKKKKKKQKIKNQTTQRNTLQFIRTKQKQIKEKENIYIYPSIHLSIELTRLFARRRREKRSKLGVWVSRGGAPPLLGLLREEDAIFRLPRVGGSDGLWRDHV